MRWVRVAQTVVLLFALIAAFSPAPARAANGGVIREIKITGAKRIEAETVKMHLTFALGQRYDPVKADESLKALYATGLFKDVRITPSGGRVTVAVVENPLINKIAYEGLSEVTSEVISKDMPVKAHGIYSQARVRAATEHILQVYKAQGFLAASVDPKVIELDHERVDLVFEIKEGPKTKVAAINFVGNKSFSDAELRRVISTTETGLLDFLRTSVVYDPDRLNLDRDLLRRHYVNNGFADARILSAIADVDRDSKGVFLTFTLDEGPRYTVGAIDVDVMLPGIKADDLTSRIPFKRGDIFNAEKVDKTVEALTLAVTEKGQPFGQVRAKLDRDPIRHTMSVVYVAEPGPRLYVERIDIVGNKVTENKVILRELRIQEGDAYNKVLLSRSKDRLMKLGFFKDVKITNEKGSRPDRVALRVAVVEEQTGELSFAAGYSSNEGVIGEISYTERNLMGTGQYLQVKLSGSVVSGSAAVSWTDPHFLDQNFAFGVDAFIKNSDYTSATGYVSAGYEDFRVGGTMRVGVPIDDELTVKFNYTLMQDTVYNLDQTASLAVKQIAGTALISSVGYSLIYDTRNKQKNPTRGFYFAGTQDFAGAGGDVNYIRSTSEMRAYYPVTDEITLAGRAMGGNIMGWGGQSVRIVDAFYKGSETIRGFQSGGLGPRDATTGDALGGTTFYSASTELRFPLPFVPQDLGLSAAVFTDAGSLFGTDAQKFAAAYVAKNGGTNTLKVQDSAIVRASAGASLIWDSPVGPLRADFSGILSKAPFDKTQTFGFGYGGW